MTVIGETHPFVSVGAQPEQAFKSEISPDNTWQTISKEKAESETLLGGEYKDVFGVLQGRNMVFCVDCSGSMYEHLPIIIHQLYEVLKERLMQDMVTKCSTQFNIIAFSTLGRRYSEEPVTLSQQSLQSAYTWLRNLETETSSNTLDALLQAFSDCTVDTVYLVTDGLPDQRPALVVECVLRNNRGRPIVSVSIGAGSNGNADLLLTDLASVTGGSFRPVTLPLKLPGPDELSALPKGAVVLLHGGVTDRNLDTSYLKQESTDLRWSGDIPSAYPTVREPPPPEKVVKFPLTAAGRLMMRKVVLARSPRRGDYNTAVIIDQHSPTCFEVEFKKNQQKERCELCHIFALQDALMHPVLKGDHVLAPVKKGGPYEPGNVVRGEDSLRGTNYHGTAGDLMVVLYSGTTVMCRAGSAIWIPKPVYNRMVTELRIVPSTKSSVEAVEALKVSEHNPTSPHDLQDYILSKNNGPRETDVCGDVPKTVVCEVVDVTPVVLEDYPCDTTDQDTILTTLSQLEIREEEQGEIPGYISGMLADEGHFDEILGVPDHPRFKEMEEEEEEEAASKPVWRYTGKAAEGNKSPTSKPMRPMSASLPRGKSTYREEYHLPSKIDMSFPGVGARPASSAVRPHTAHSSTPSVSQLKERERAKRDAQAHKKQDRLLLAKTRVTRQLKERDAMKEQRGLQVSKDTKFREGPTGQALSRFADKKKLKNTGSHQQIGSRAAEANVIRAVSHAVQTDNKYYVSRLTA
ncbi:uncharacterized protein LOC134816841 isoform X2 [Bolinopsis microptera]|uniref:uncharacterized protein LOC134816841 isoform X2 n=1 Tax=Bolinopsis microptera TaxID=2820187 RepID=UPI003079C19D